MLERAQLLNDTCNTSEGGTHRAQVKTPAGHKTLCPGGPVIARSSAKAKGAVPPHNYSCTNAYTHTHFPRSSVDSGLVTCRGREAKQ